MTEFSTEPVSRASLLRRLSAGVYDLFLLFAVAFLYSAIILAISNYFGLEVQGLNVEQLEQGSRLSATSDYQAANKGPLFGTGLYTCLVLFYIGFWHFRRATLGMQTWRMRIVTSKGKKPLKRQLLIRALAGTFSLAFFGLGFFIALFDQQQRTLHDRLSKTCIILLPSKKKKKIKVA